MPLREPAPPLTLSFGMTNTNETMTAAAPSAEDAASNASTILDQCLQLPKLNLGSCSMRSGTGVSTAGVRRKYLELIEPLKYPFTTGAPAWCVQDFPEKKPRAISLLDVYKNHEFLTTHTVYQKGMYLIGRNAAICDIVLSHCSISRLHAGIMHHEDGTSVYLVDLGSAHGTFLDGVRLKPCQPTLMLHGSQLKFGASSRSYTYKSFDSREQIAAIVNAQIGLNADELELNRNTLLNRAVSYRLELSPSMQNGDDDPMAYPQQYNGGFVASYPEDPQGHQRRSSTDDLTLSLAAFRHDEQPARKRSRGQSGTSQGSSDNSMGGDASHFALDNIDVQDVEEEEEEMMLAPAAVPKRVHFTPHPPTEIPPMTYAWSMAAADAERDASPQPIDSGSAVATVGGGAFGLAIQITSDAH
uniref:FHA domain-containing protein n=1 Tax=Globisporangium ultimum (strain ATCC 200006 / CBS 805.95 / DAOM BR144) TaxID=431595 RepID=K3W6F9_GLOUD